MPYKRTGYAPWSLTREAGVQSATVDGTIQVPQYITPVLDTGFVDFKGEWKGRVSNDDTFNQFQTDLAVANGAEIISNEVIDMKDYDIMMLALKVSNGGNYTFELLLGGDANDAYYNLKPINTAFGLRATIRTDSQTNTFETVLADTESVSATGVWNIYKVNDLRGFNFKLKLTNSSGGSSDMETAIMRIV